MTRDERRTTLEECSPEAVGTGKKLHCWNANGPKKTWEKKGRQNNTTTTDEEEEEEPTPFLLFSFFDCERETCFDRSNRLDGMLLFFCAFCKLN